MHTLFEVESVATGNLRIQYRTRYRSPKLHALLENPDQYLADNECIVLKPPGNATAVFRTLVENRWIVIKHYDTNSAWRKFRRAVRRSRAENCWLNALLLKNLGIAVAPPIAFIQEYLGAGLKSRSWYLSEFVDGLSCLDHLPTIEDEDVCEQTMVKIIDTLLNLWDHHISHGDMKASNFLVAQDQVVVLDLDAMKQHKSAETARPRIRKDRARFLRNWQNHPVILELACGKLADRFL